MTSTDETDSTSALNKSIAPFILKLRKLVSTCPKEVARWSEDGTRFDVIRSDLFEEHVCDEFAGGDRLRSRTVMRTFVRQLQFYAFKKVTAAHAHDMWGFWHQHFLRDDVPRQALIKRYARASQRDEEEPEVPPPTSPMTYEPVSAADEARLVEELRRKVASLELKVKELSGKLTEAEAKNRVLAQQLQEQAPRVEARQPQPQPLSPAPSGRVAASVASPAPTNPAKVLRSSSAGFYVAPMSLLGGNLDFTREDTMDSLLAGAVPRTSSVAGAAAPSLAFSNEMDDVETCDNASLGDMMMDLSEVDASTAFFADELAKPLPPLSPEPAAAANSAARSDMSQAQVAAAGYLLQNAIMQTVRTPQAFMGFAPHANSAAPLQHGGDRHHALRGVDAF